LSPSGVRVRLAFGLDIIESFVTTVEARGAGSGPGELARSRSYDRDPPRDFQAARPHRWNEYPPVSGTPARARFEPEVAAVEVSRA
jgi:hypothetical protein